jgi:hypothetical protein
VASATSRPVAFPAVVESRVVESRVVAFRVVAFRVVAAFPEVVFRVVVFRAAVFRAAVFRAAGPCLLDNLDHCGALRHGPSLRLDSIPQAPADVCRGLGSLNDLVRQGGTPPERCGAVAQAPAGSHPGNLGHPFAGGPPAGLFNPGELLLDVGSLVER